MADAKTVQVDLPAEIFDAKVNIPLMHQVVVAQQAAARQGTHSTKRRGEVRGGGRKPYKQKGTGRARQGSTRAPQFAGGGVVHGPKPRDYDQRTPKKMKAAALRGALSDRARNGRIHVIADFGLDQAPSTRTALAVLAGLTDRVRYLVVLERTDTLTWLSLRNAQEVHIVAVDQLNTYDVLASDDVVFTQGSYDAFVNGTASSADRATEIDSSALQAAKADQAEKQAPAAEPVAVSETTVEAPAAETDAVELPKGAKAPLKSGNAPKGYEIKGNADSGLYHEPGSRSYDATVAEFWFKTAEDAEAAGYTKAGAPKADAADAEEADK